MLFPNYINGVISEQSKNKEVYQVRQQIRKIFVYPLSQKIQHLMKIDQKPKIVSMQRKTVPNGLQITNSKNFPNAGSTPFRSTQKSYSQKKLVNKALQKSKGFYQQEQGSAEGSQVNMNAWRTEIMKHIRPERTVDIKQKIPIKKQQQKTEEETRDRKLLKIRTIPSKFKDKYNSRNKLLQQVSQSISQKNFILIRPISIVEDNHQKNMEKHKKPLSKIRKAIANRRFQYNKAQLEWNELALQRLANFQALLPFLGTRKANIEKKDQKKQIVAKYEPIDEQRYSIPRSQSKQKIQRNEPIVGWQTLQQL